MEDSEDTVEPPSNGTAWIFWLIATTLLPAIAGQQRMFVMLVAAFIVHLVASLKIKGLQGCALLLLYFGGWALMLGTFIACCEFKI